MAGLVVAVVVVVVGREAFGMEELWPVGQLPNIDIWIESRGRKQSAVSAALCRCWAVRASGNCAQLQRNWTAAKGRPIQIVARKWSASWGFVALLSRLECKLAAQEWIAEAEKQESRRAKYQQSRTSEKQKRALEIGCGHSGRAKAIGVARNGFFWFAKLLENH